MRSMEESRRHPVAGAFGALALVVASAFSLRAASPTPAEVAEELLAADRAFAKQAAGGDVIAALVPMFAEDVVMPVPGGQFARGVEAVTAALQANPDNKTSRIEWTPVRAGVSADGHHGFTFGYMTLRRPDNSETPAKYLAYWVKQPAGWRIAVYKRGRSSAPPASRDVLAPALPARIVAVNTDAAAIEEFRRSLDAVERAFSDEAQKIGLGPAFAKYGSADAVNLGPPTEAAFIHGAEAIGRSVGAGSSGPSELSWAPDSVIVASSGDLGVTIGTIRRNKPAADGKESPRIPFFTIWRRAGPADAWKYVAE